jgi:predicted TIM-barrel fold metal-dependent hydrolase
MTTSPLEGIGVIDTMMGVPSPDKRWWMRSFGSMIHDQESKEKLQHAAGYMFHELPEIDPSEDPIGHLLREMDRYGIAKSLIPVTVDAEPAKQALAKHPDRFMGSYLVDPVKGVEEVRMLKRVVRELGVVAAACFPAGCVPQVAISDPQLYPFYAACVELDIPIFVNAGVPGPRVPMYCQDVAHLDQVMYDFPELRLVTRHGGEPWQDLAIKLMLKWPGLHYSTSAFAPKHYPKAIVDYANTRGADKIIYAGYYPSGLTLERIFRELPDVPFKAEVWPKFLRDNALRVLKQEG